MEQQVHQNRQEVDTRLPFRKGWPVLPTLPVETSPPDRNLISQPEWETIIPQIMHILAQNHVFVTEGFLCYRYNKGVSVSERMPTLLVYSDIEKEGQDIEVWRRAAWQIRNMLQQQNINNIVIKIVDQRINEEIKTDIIHSDEKEVLDAWTELAPRIFECLSEHNWISLDLLHRSWIGAQQDAKATVVIGAADANDSLSWMIQCLRCVPYFRNFLESNLSTLKRSWVRVRRKLSDEYGLYDAIRPCCGR